MINELINSICGLLTEAIDNLPDVESFSVPNEVYSGIHQIFSFVGWLMPYQIYMPLITFILSLTAFRIVYALYIHFKR